MKDTVNEVKRFIFNTRKTKPKILWGSVCIPVETGELVGSYHM